VNQALVRTEQEPRSVLVDMAHRFGMEPQAFELTVRATCSPAPRRGEQARPLTREEFAAFLLVARQYKLNPITREIFAYPKRGGGVVPIVSIDGWVNLVNSHPACDGFDFAVDHDADGRLYSCTCVIYRKDRNHPTAVTEYFSECWRDTDPWKMAHRMLRHKALIQCARYAFGFAGIYDEEEGQRIAEDRLSALPAPAQAPRPPKPAARAEGQQEAPQGQQAVPSEPAGTDPAPADVSVIGDVDFFDILQDRLAEATDAETIEEIWTELDPMARFENQPLPQGKINQDMCLAIKNRFLRQIGEVTGE
jgi:hypothetical protein